MKTRILTLIMSLFVMTMIYSSNAFSNVTIDNFLYHLNDDMTATLVEFEGDKSKITSLAIPATVTYTYNKKKYTVTKIEDRAFFMDDFKEITLPNTIINIGNDAFCNMRKLESINIPTKINTIGKDAFSGCVSLSSDLIISNSIKSIDDYAFYNCPNLTYITFYTDNIEMGEKIFDSNTNILFYQNGCCYTLHNDSNTASIRAEDKTLQQIAIPSTINFGEYNSYSITKIEDRAFYNCSTLTSIEIPNSVISIGSYAFYNTNLTSINIPINISYINKTALPKLDTIIWNAINYKDCKVKESPLSSAKIIVFGDEVEHVPAALCSFNNFSTVKFGKNIKSIGENLFYGGSLDTIIWDVEKYTKGTDDIFYYKNSLKPLEYSVNEKVKVVILGDNVKEIGPFCTNLNKIKEIFIPANVSKISGRIGGLSLTSIYVDEKNLNYTSIDGVLYDRNVTILISVPATKSLIEIPNSVTSIGYYVLHNKEWYNNQPDGCVYISNKLNKWLYTYKGEMSSKTQIDIQEGTTQICDRAFYYYENLISIKIPNSVTLIGNYAFYRCEGLTSVKIPNSVTSIGKDAFSICTNLREITIGSNVTEIGDAAFQLGSDFTLVYCLAPIPPRALKSSFDSNFYKENPGNHRLFVLYSSLNEYKSTYPYNEFFWIYASFYAITTLVNNENMGSISGDGIIEKGKEITLTATANEGYTFVKWSDGNTENPRKITVLQDSTFTAIFGKAFTISTTVNDDTMGIVLGAGEYGEGHKITLTAKATEGYHFVKWSDGNTENPRTIVVTEDVELLAEFAINQYNVKVTSGGNGLVNWVNGVYNHGDKINIMATPNQNYHFVKWSDDNIENPRTITVTEDIELKAEFATNTCILTLFTENGTVKGGGTYNYGEEAIIEAVANKGYHFVKWSDGNTENPRTIVVTEDLTLTAEFAINQYEVNVKANENGTVTGGGTYDYGEEAIIEAVVNKGYHFVKWSDGNTENPRTIVVTEDLTLTAEFAINQYKVVVESEGNGSVTGSGTYNHGSEVTIEAVANKGYHFVKWSDGNTENPRTIVVTEDVELMAEFAINQYEVSVTADGNGTVTGSGTYDYGTEVTIEAIANEGYHFVKWSDGNTENPRTIVVTEDVELMAEFAINQYEVEVKSDENGYATGSGTYDYGTEVTIEAIANEGYHFVEWSDGNTENPRTIVVTEDVELTAEFELDGTPVDNVDESSVIVYVQDGVIYVEGIDADYNVFDASGRLIYTGCDTQLQLPRGVYVIAVGGEVEKVVI